MNNVVVVGGSYAGLTAALTLRRLLPNSDTVTVVSANADFIFLPSLIWVIQGERDLADIAFPIRPVLEEAGVSFINARLEAINPQNKTISLSAQQSLKFDKLLLTTGGEWEWGTVPGLWPKPKGHTISMLSPQDALNARAEWQALLADPGPIVIGVALNTDLYGAAYEFALNLDIALRKAGVRDQATITFVTPEPYLGHFGHDGLGNSRQIIEKAFLSQKIMFITEAQIDHIEAEAVMLSNRQQRLSSCFTMVVPPYRGIKPVQEVPELADERGRIPVDNYYRSLNYADIFAAGSATQLKPQAKTLLPCGTLITGTVSAKMARIAALNIASDLGYREPVPKPAGGLKAFYVLDSGSQGLFMSLGSQRWLNLQLNIAGPWSHWAKVIAEKYQMWQLQTGNITTRF